MQKELLGFSLLLISSALGVVGQLLFKQSAVGGGVQVFGLDLWYFVAGGAVYFVSLVIYVVALRWIPLHIAYPTLALGYVGLFAISAYSGEPVSVHQGAAMALIIGGVALLWS